jgi:LuxR family maltose regulon positive regulatory protein
VSAATDVLNEEDQTDLASPGQNEALLRTKLFVPPLRPDRVHRPRLFDQLESGLGKALLLVAAPAGYGKTTLVSSWLRGTDIPATWLSLDEDDNDPIRFLQYFIAALRRIMPAVQLDWLVARQDTQPGSTKVLVNGLVNAIAYHTSEFVLVLDDFQIIQAPSVLEFLAYLLEHLPSQMHIVMITRTDPPLPLARMRARNGLTEIRADQLRFTQAEIAVLLNKTMGLELSSNDIGALEARTEGWIAGLQLASVAMQATSAQARVSQQRRRRLHEFISAFTGSHSYIMDYLVEEVFSRQSDLVRTFLLQSSILERMCGSLCESVVDSDQAMPVDGQAMLETLEQANLFLIPLDDERRWYRYHQLFADVLNRRLELSFGQRLPDLHRRASQWYGQNGFISEAVQHARLSGDKERTAQLVDQYGCLLLMGGEVVNLLKWIEAVEPHSQTRPWIAIQKAWSLCLTGQLDRVEGPLETAGRLVSSLELTDESRTMSGAVIAARAYRANMQGETRQAAELARQALSELPVVDDFSCSLRSAATSILGDASWMDGDLMEAGRAYTQALQISQTAGNIHMAIITNSNLADVLMEQGQLHRAGAIYAEALRMATLADGQISPLAGRAYAGLSHLSYEWNHLEDAEGYAHRCIEHSRRWGSFEYEAIGDMVLASLEQVRGNPEKAREAMRAAAQLLYENQRTPWWPYRLESALARLAVFLGDLETASDLVERNETPPDRLPAEGGMIYQQRPWILIQLRLHLARGDQDTALRLSGELLQRLEPTKHAGKVIEILILQALAFQGKRDTDKALAILERACAMARQEGYVRTFLDEGTPMARLLYQARSQHIAAGYVAELLSAIGEASGSPVSPATLLIESLTPREVQVLELIEAGYSNQQIADRLVISIPTVKRHISNIYTKLGTDSRTQAIARGKELGLFS